MYMYMSVNTHVPFAGLHRSAQGVQPSGTSNAHFKPIASKGIHPVITLKTEEE